MPKHYSDLTELFAKREVGRRRRAKMSMSEKVKGMDKLRAAADEFKDISRVPQPPCLTTFEVIVERTGKLRHDRWKDKATSRWTGKVFIAIDPGEGSVRSKGLAAEAARSEAA